MLKKLDHVNVRTAQVQKMITWYVEVLGMQSGYRPYFPFSGAWLYIGENPVVHLVDVDGEPGVGAETDLKLEHFAFSASNRTRFEEKLNRIGEPFRRDEVKDVKIFQYNLWDPDGNHIHVDFPADE